MLANLVLLALSHGSLKIDCEVKTLPYHPVSGKANAYGICLWTDHVGYAFNIQGSSTARIEDAGRVVFFEPMKGGFCLNQRLYAENGTPRSAELGLMPMGVNSKGQAAGFVKQGEDLFVAAVSDTQGNVSKVGPSYRPQDIARIENSNTASKCWDVNDEGAYVLTALVPSKRRTGLSELVPMIGRGTKFERLPLPNSDVDAYPLRFGFDGSIVGSAYRSPTIMATGWGTGTHGVLQSDGVIWKSGKPKIAALGALGNPQSNEVGPTVFIADSSGGTMLGYAVFYNRETEQPTRKLTLIWHGNTCNKATEVVAVSGLEITGLLGFTSPTTFAAIGMRANKDVLVIAKIAK